MTILVNGLPLVHCELKRRGVPLKEAFNQINRYGRESFWAGNGLFDYIQVFIISNGTETKYYFADMGVRAAILNFRQQEESHILENLIYNELRMRGYRIDVGAVEVWTVNSEGKKVRVSLEVDFVVNKGAERIYIQSAYNMPTEDKTAQEKRPLLNTNDSFRKIIIVGDDIKRKTDEQGIVTMSLYDFFLDSHSIDRL